MLLTHPLKGLLGDLVIEVVIRLFFLFFLLLFLQSFEPILLIDLLILEIHDDLHRLHVFLRVYLVNFSEELTLIETPFPIIYHIHGQLHFFRQHLAIVRLEDMIENLVNPLEEGMLVHKTG